MRSPASSPPASRWRAYAWGVLAALTCPCHLPVLVIVLAGTTAGAFLSAHWGIAAVTMITVFSVSGVLTWRAVHSEDS
uniref:Urf-1 protein n=1 Tax=Xanthomonas campestris TaxID=339 RepID=Q9RCD9_XANCA|nr:Urf-1 protein [Xanthomonas campestris]